MNPLNYGSLEAPKRLVEAGIVLETDAVYTKLQGLILREDTIYEGIPAPSMAEVWRELPEYRTISGCICVLSLFQERKDLSVAAYDWHGEWLMNTRNSNPTDALIDLLIWVRKETP